jgi:microcompartment protein CcmK/EutM
LEVDLKYLLAFLICSLPLLAHSGPKFSALVGQDLLGNAFDLEERLAGRPSVLVFGFTKASNDPSKEWVKGLVADLGSDTRTAIVSIAVLEKAPKFVRGFITRSMKKEIPVERWAWTVVLTSGSEERQEEVGYDKVAAPDEAYVVVLTGHSPLATMKLHEPYSDAAKGKVVALVKKMLER